MWGNVSLFSVLLILASVPPVLAEDPVDFADPRLKAAVEETLWVTDPTPTDMLGLTELAVLNTAYDERGIEDLAGLEYAKNLQSLSLRRHQFDSLAPLADLVNLETLLIQRTEVSGITSLAGLTKLWKLDLEQNQISDISVLSDLTSLTSINLHRNRIDDITPLLDFTTLTWLDLRVNPLSEEAHETHIPQIFDNNPGIWFVHDPSFHRRLLLDSTLGGSVTCPGEGSFLYKLNETIWLIAEPDPCFVFVTYAGSYTTSRNPMQFTIDQDHEIRACFASVLDTLHVDDDAPGDPAPGDGRMSDPHENGTALHPFDCVQEAIDAAAEGARVLVHPGTYLEEIDLRAKNIQVTGIDPNASDPMDYPILNGDGRGPVVRFAGGQDPNCLLSGFVITGGWDPQAGAILCSDASPTVTHCVIVANHATDPNGAAIFCTEGSPRFVNCTVADNLGGAFHLADCNAVVVNSIVWNNGGREIAVPGTSQPLIVYSDIAGGFPGPGNLDADPLFVGAGAWGEGDYHLKSPQGRWDAPSRIWKTDDALSPCIDAGDPASAVGSEPTPNGDTINMGAYGGTTQASHTPSQ